MPVWVERRVSSKQTKINFGSNRNKPKQDLFRVCFGLFRETKNKKIRFFSVFQTFIETTETKELFHNKPKQKRNNPKFSEKYPNILSFKLFGWVFCLFRINQNSLFRYRSETTVTPKQTVSKQTETTLNFRENTKICSLSNCFGWSSIYFGSIERSERSYFLENSKAMIVPPTAIFFDRWRSRFLGIKFFTFNKKKLRPIPRFAQKDQMFLKWSQICFYIEL